MAQDEIIHDARESWQCAVENETGSAWCILGKGHHGSHSWQTPTHAEVARLRQVVGDLHQRAIEQRDELVELGLKQPKGTRVRSEAEKLVATEALREIRTTDLSAMRVRNAKAKMGGIAARALDRIDRAGG